MRTRPLVFTVESVLTRVVLAFACLIAACRSNAPTTESPLVLPAIFFEGTRTESPARLKSIAEAELVALYGKIKPRAAVDDAAFTLAEYYRSKGFRDVSITFSWSPPSQDEPRGEILFTVDEGARVVISELLFRGNTSLDAKGLTALYRGQRTGALGTGRLLYDEELAGSFSSVLEDRYYELGYLEVRVERPEVLWDDSRTEAKVVYAITEGPRFILESVELIGIDDSLRGHLAGVAGQFLGQPYIPEVLYEVRGKLQEYFAESGYPDAQLRGTRLEDPEPGRVAIEFTIDPGSEVRIGEIRLSGTSRTRESTARKLVAFREGELYRLSEERETFQALYGSGLFDSVTIDLEERANGIADVSITLEESSSLTVFVEPGYGSYEKIRVRAGIRDSNMFGLGHTGRIETTLGFLAQQIEVGYTDPFLFDTPLELDLSSYWTRREEPSFLRREAGAGATVTHRFDERWRVALGYRFRRSIADEIEVVDPATLAIDEPIDVSSITLTPTHDTRDGIFTPTTGDLSRLILEYAGTALGSEITFARVRGHLAHFYELRDGLVFASAARTGVIVPLADTDEIPLQERFFNGGETMVRSFRQDQLGPLDATGIPIGGETFTTLNAELRQDISKTTQVAAFFDTGNVTTSSSQYWKFDDFQHGLGVGVRYLLPIGPLRLDWGWNPNPRPADELWVLHLSVGMAF